jgi:hypothetical protein
VGIEIEKAKKSQEENKLKELGKPEYIHLGLD